VGEGNRKDVRNAVEAAHAAKWADTAGHARAQILYYIAENLATRADEFSRRLESATGLSAADARAEVDSSIETLFRFAAWADKFDGYVHSVPYRDLTLALPEPIGVMGLVCPEEKPLLGFVGLVAPAIAMGNTIIAVPSESSPLSATDFYQVLETSDVPAGVVNIVTGSRDTLAAVLAAHDDVDGIWYFGGRDGITAVEEASAGNMKRTWAHEQGEFESLASPRADEEILRACTQVKNIWAPYGE
jgi:aldehyde dehydrogenase (NAD+)